MKKNFSSLLFLILLGGCSSAGIVDLPIQDALNSDLAHEKLSGDITFSFGKSNISGKSLGTWVSNKKTNNVGKSIENSCQRAFISALISLQARAIQEGGRSVTNIHSFYKKSPYWSYDNFQCDEGHIMSGVTLRGTVVK